MILRIALQRRYAALDTSANAGAHLLTAPLWSRSRVAVSCDDWNTSSQAAKKLGAKSGMHLGGSPRIHAGKERFSAPGKARLQSCALALGPRNPVAKAHHKIEPFSAGLKSNSPLLKQRAATNGLLQSFSTACKACIYTID
jgi:hypothetical protein